MWTCYNNTLKGFYCELFVFSVEESVNFLVDVCWKRRGKLCIKALGKLFQFCRIKLN